MQPVVVARKLGKRFGTREAVVDVDLEVPAGRCFGLLGPNGAGKTTAMRMIYGVTRPSRGSVEVFGLDVARHPREVRARLGVALQENALIEVLSAEENLRVFGRYHLLREPELGRRIDELLSFFELGAQARVPVRQLSGGFQRRLAIARSLMNRPELLILDEPTTGLDPAVRIALWSRIRELLGAGTTVLLTTHYMDEAERLCDRVAIIAEGRLRSEGPPKTLIRERLAAEAVEFDCSPHEEAALLDGLVPPALRLRAGRRLIACADDATPILERVHGAPGAERRAIVARPTNLEDVFLAVAGTRLEGGP